MKFRDDELEAIVFGQADPIGVRDANGVELGVVSPGEALEIIAGGGWSGVGHRRRIRFIRENRGHETLRLASLREKALARGLLVNSLKAGRGSLVAPGSFARESPGHARQKRGTDPASLMQIRGAYRAWGGSTC